MTTNLTQLDFMKMMQEFKMTIETTIETSVDTIGKKIKDSIDVKMTKIDENLKNLNVEVAEIDKKVGDAAKQNEKLAKRIETLEQNQKRNNFKNMKSDTLGKTNVEEKNEEIEKTKEMNVQPTGRTAKSDQPNKEKNLNREDQPLQRQSSWSEEVEEEWRNRQKENDFHQWTKQRRIPNNWTDDVEIYTKDLSENSEKKERLKEMENTKQPEKTKRKIEVEKRKAVVNWFGYDQDSSEEETEDDTEDDDSNDWNKVERTKKKKEKKIRQREKRKMKIEETARKAQKMIGLGPFSKQELNEQCEKEDDYEKVKVNMVKNHLRKIYKYNTEELNKIKIEETKITIKDEIFIYIAVKELEDIREIYRRKAEIKRDDVILRNYIPPQFFSRFTALNNICKLRREEDPQLKTQIRFSSKDLEIMTKKKGSTEPFVKTSMNDFVGEQELPSFDTKIKWKKTTDRKPRRIITSSRESSPVANSNRKSLENLTKNRKSTDKHALSWSSNESPRSKIRKDSSLDSCNSGDLSGALESKNMETNEHDKTL